MTEIDNDFHNGVIQKHLDEQKAEDTRKKILAEQQKLSFTVLAILEWEKNTERDIVARLVLNEVEKHRDYLLKI